MINVRHCSATNVHVEEEKRVLTANDGFTTKIEKDGDRKRQTVLYCTCSARESLPARLSSTFLKQELLFQTTSCCSTVHQLLRYCTVCLVQDTRERHLLSAYMLYCAVSLLRRLNITLRVISTHRANSGIFRGAVAQF